MGLPFIGGTQEADMTALLDREEVFDRMTLLLAAVVILLVLGIDWAVDRVVYLQRTDKSPTRKTGGIPPFHDVGREMTWDTTRFATHRCSSDCFGSVCFCMGHGDGGDPRRARRRPRPLSPSRSVLVTRSPFPALFRSLTARRVSTPSYPAVRHLPPPHLGSSSGADAGVRLTPSTNSAPSRPVGIMAGSGGAISGRMAIRVVVPGGNGPAWRVGAIFSKPMARRCMASACPRGDRACHGVV